MAHENGNVTGCVLEIQRMSTEDGPGLRTTVFLKGCPLACEWCHNPESIPAKPQIQWIESRCLGCKSCVDVCPNHAVEATPSGIVIDKTRCVGCGTCAEACPSTALELQGNTWTPEALADEVAKDRAFFEQSDEGGITVSGGEATLQADFVEAFFMACRARGLRTALDTCGYCQAETLGSLLPLVDLVLLDLKAIDPEKHKAYTHRDNAKILENATNLASWVRSHPETKLWVRTPIIPETTADPEQIADIGRFIASNMDGAVSRWELCSFNNLCRDKYVRLGIDWRFKEAELMTADDMERMADSARHSGVDPDIVHWSGSTRLENESKGEEGTNVPELQSVKNCQTCG